MPPDAQTKAGSIGGIGVVEEGVAVRALPKAKAQVPEVVEAAAPMEVDGVAPELPEREAEVAGEEGAATSAGGLEPACPPVPMLCSIFSSQVWRAAGLEPRAVGTRRLVHEEEEREVAEERAREEKVEAARRKLERAVKARRARAAKSQVTPASLKERGLNMFMRAEKCREREAAEAKAEEAARASRAATAHQAEPSQRQETASSPVRGAKEEQGLRRGGETPPQVTQATAKAGPSDHTTLLRRKPPDFGVSGVISSDPSAESSGEEGGPTPPKSPPRVTKPKSPTPQQGEERPLAATPGLDDEQLAMLLHQELNAPSSRRRRGRDAGATSHFGGGEQPSPKRRRGGSAAESSSPNSPLSPVAPRAAAAGGGGKDGQGETDVAKPVDLSAALSLHA